MNANFNETSSKYNLHTHIDITQVGAITTGSWTGSVIGTAYGGTGNAYGLGLPSGSVFFMVTGACPSGSTDVTDTYADMFPRVMDDATSTPATAAATAHSHAAGTLTEAAHTHTVPRDGWGSADAAIDGRLMVYEGTSGGQDFGGATGDNTSGSDGDDTVTGSTATDDAAIPAHFTVRICQIN